MSNRNIGGRKIHTEEDRKVAGEIGRRIRLLRYQKHLSIFKLSEMLDTSTTTISGWELSGHFPSSQSVIKLSEIFGVTTDYILKGE